MRARRFMRPLPAVLPVVLLVVALGASACGGGSNAASTSTKRVPGSWSTKVCTQVAQGVAWNGEQALRHYRPPLSNYPPDVALLGVKTPVSGLQRHRCPLAIVGRVLARRLTPRQRAELYTHLPPLVARYLRGAVAQA